MTPLIKKYRISLTVVIVLAVLIHFVINIRSYSEIVQKIIIIAVVPLLSSLLLGSFVSWLNHKPSFPEEESRVNDFDLPICIEFSEKIKRMYRILSWTSIIIGIGIIWWFGSVMDFETWNGPVFGYYLAQCFGPGFILTGYIILRSINWKYFIETDGITSVEHEILFKIKTTHVKYIDIESMDVTPMGTIVCDLKNKKRVKLSGPNGHCTNLEVISKRKCDPSTVVFSNHKLSYQVIDMIKEVATRHKQNCSFLVN